MCLIILLLLMANMIISFDRYFLSHGRSMLRPYNNPRDPKAAPTSESRKQKRGPFWGPRRLPGRGNKKITR